MARERSADSALEWMQPTDLERFSDDRKRQGLLREIGAIITRRRGNQRGHEEKAGISADMGMSRYTEMADDIVQEVWYTDQYPDSVTDYGEAEAMAYASKHDKETAIEQRQKAEEAERGIGQPDYKPTPPRMSAKEEVDWHLRKASEATARTHRYMKEASEAYRALRGLE